MSPYASLEWSYLIWILEHWTGGARFNWRKISSCQILTISNGNAGGEGDGGGGGGRGDGVDGVRGWGPY